jgi:hypothetical protein
MTNRQSILVFAFACFFLASAILLANGLIAEHHHRQRIALRIALIEAEYQRIKRDKYDRIKVGMARAEVHSIMGTPPGPPAHMDPRLGCWEFRDWTEGSKWRTSTPPNTNVSEENWNDNDTVLLTAYYAGEHVTEKQLAAFHPDAPGQ